MKSVGIESLNSKLSAYVQLAATGETILITDGNRVVAELGPIRSTRTPVVDDLFPVDLVRSGVLTPPSMPSSTPPPKPNPIGSFEDIRRELNDSREDR